MSNPDNKNKEEELDRLRKIEEDRRRKLYEEMKKREEKNHYLDMGRKLENN